MVKSANSTVSIDRICRGERLEAGRGAVGFKYICEKMRETDVLIGGEESGGIGFQGHIPERDGILANLMLLEMLTVTGKRLSEIARDVQKEFGASFYDRIDMHFPMRETLRNSSRRRGPRHRRSCKVLHAIEILHLRHRTPCNSFGALARSVSMNFSRFSMGKCMSMRS